MHRRRITGEGHKEKENGKIKIEEEEKGGERNVIVHEEKENHPSPTPPFPLSLFPSSLRHVYIHNYLQKKNISKVKNVCAKVKRFFFVLFWKKKVVKTVTSSC